MLATAAKAPDFELPAADGKPVRLSELIADGPVLLAFFKTTCPVCQFTFPFLERLTSSGNIVGISQDGPASTADFCRDSGLTFPMLLDRSPGYAASNAYGITHVPSLFLVEPGGRIAVAGSGFSRGDLEAIASVFGTSVFREGEQVPDFQPG